MIGEHCEFFLWSRVLLDLADRPRPETFEKDLYLEEKNNLLSESLDQSEDGQMWKMHS